MRRKFSVVAATLVAGIALTACTDPSVGAGPTVEVTDTDTVVVDEETAPPAAASDWPDPTADLSGKTITLWAAQSSNTIPNAVVAAFEEETGATVNVVTVPDPYEQGVQTRVATGDLPDLAFWQPTPSMLTALNAPTNLLPLDDAPWLDEMNPELRDVTGILDGTRYAALISSPAVMGVYYNKQVFADAGITTLPTNWEELMQVAAQLRDAGHTAFFDFVSPTGWATQWAVQVQLADAAKDGLWERINTGEESFTDPTVLGAIENYRQMIDDGLYNANITTATFEDQATALLNGDAGMAIQINALMGSLQAQVDSAELDDKIGFFAISPNGNTATVIPDQANALVAFRTGDAEREAAAKQLLAFWLGDGYETFIADQGGVSLFPAVATPAATPQLAIDVADSLGDSVGSMQAEAVANPDLFLYLGDMVHGQMSPEQVAQNVQNQFAQLARAQGIPGF